MTFRPIGPADGATREPRSVAQDNERAALAVRAVHEIFQPAPDDEVRAWARLESRRERAHHAWPFAMLGAVAAAGAVGVVFALAGGRIGGQPGNAPVARVDVRAPAKPPEPEPTVLRAGSSVLPGGLRAHLRDSGRAAWVATAAARGHVVLETGTLDIDADAPVDVRVASLRVDGSAGRFRIATRGRAVDVTVERGEVVVWSSVRLLKRVVAGERWTSPDPAGRPEAAPPAPASPPATRAYRMKAPAPAAPSDAPAAPAPTETRDCLRLAHDGVTDAAIACFEGQTAQSGLTAEIALLELARIRRDVKGDLAGAERLVAEHRRRFLHSALAVEARTLHVELLLRLDRPAEAFAEAERLTGTEAIFWRAASLEKLGRRDEAARAFDDYLQHGDVERRGEAARRRRGLGP